jgi:hypothetical protein
VPIVQANGSITYGAQANGTAAGYKNTSADLIRYVSKSGSDANDGLSWGSSFLTVGAAHASLNGFPGIINIANGSYTVQNLAISNGQVLRGSSVGYTVLQLTANGGRLLDLTNCTGGYFEYLFFEFASSSVTGTLAYMSNAFRMFFNRCYFKGQNAAGQVGVHLRANAGDSHFVNTVFTNFDVAVQNDTTVNTFQGCNFQTNTTAAIQGGDPSGAVAAAGIVVRDCVFGGAGAYYINITGKAQQWHVDGTWFDGGLSGNIGINVGSGSYGPWLFALTNCPSMFGNTKSLVINAADSVHLDGVVWGNDGSYPIELEVNAANCKRGSLGAYFSLQDTHIETIIPPSWKGAVGYVMNADQTVRLIENYSYLDTPVWEPMVHKRIIVRVANRTTSTAATTITFPQPFTTTWAGGQFFKTFDNTAIGAGLTFDAASITLPANVECASGMVIIEGF